MSFKEIKPEELQKNPFQMIGKEWLLVTAEKDGKANIGCRQMPLSRIGSGRKIMRGYRRHWR